MRLRHWIRRRESNRCPFNPLGHGAFVAVGRHWSQPAADFVDQPCGRPCRLRLCPATDASRGDRFNAVWFGCPPSRWSPDCCWVDGFLALIGRWILSHSNPTAFPGRPITGGGQVVIGNARRGEPAQVRWRDMYGTTHNLMAEPLRDGETISAGEAVLIVKIRDRQPRIVSSARADPLFR